MKELPELYFKTDIEWRHWLHENHAASKGIHLIFYKVEHENDSMRWEEAVQVAICYGWIDSTVKSLGGGKRKQYFCPRKPKSAWSKLNKTYVEELIANGQMHQSGLKGIEQAKKDGSWTAFDDVENRVIPKDLMYAFNNCPKAYLHYQNFSNTYQKGYLYWLSQAKRKETREKRINEIIALCKANKKSRQ